MNRIYCILFILSLSGFTLSGQMHPNLTITKKGVELIQSNLGNIELFDQTLKTVRQEVDQEIENGIEVPVPIDMAGGYTHERHKKNFFILQKAGNLYQITKEEKYAKYIKESLLAYAKLYPTLPIHPTNRSYATGKIFWQCLNDANWLLYVSQAYDCIYDYLSKKERQHLEDDLFKPFADFISIENPKFFNRIHNHSTWANAAVGMIGLVMNDQDLINRSLYGIEDDGIDESEIDNDGGYIKVKGIRQAGFLAQLDFSFGPDGYFTEGPYYLRYAIFPFLVYAKALQNHMPELDILNYRNGILEKAVYALLLQADNNGKFFPLNDAQKGMSWNARELITAIDMIYTYKSKDPKLLDIATQQNAVLLDDTGYEVAKAINENFSEEYIPYSINFKDGKTGEEGGVSVLRNDDICLVLKYSAQGMGHGHFDKLSYSLYNDAGEVVQDYGAVRWVNIDQKGGGRYLPENKSFGKQTIAHNTIVIDETSHYEASVKKGEEHHPELYHLDFENPNAQFVSTYDLHAYPGTGLHRTMLLIDDETFAKPIVVDIFKVKSKEKRKMDLPFWFQGHLLSTSFDCKKHLDQLETLGEDYGYQHIWKEASGQTNGIYQMCFLGNSKFYTLSSIAEETDELILARAGANDPNFNLRNDPVFIQRKTDTNESIFVSIIEEHGHYDRVTEVPTNPFSEVKNLEIKSNDEKYTVITITSKEGTQLTVAISFNDKDSNKSHALKIENEELKWEGVFKVYKN